MNPSTDHQSTLNNGTFCNLQVSIWTASKKVPTGEVSLGNTDETLFRINKDLVEKSVLKPIRQQAQQAGEILHNRALPFNIRGIYYIPNQNISSVIEKVNSIRDLFWQKVDEFCHHYDEYRQQAQQRLNGHFREEDYPNSCDIRDKFNWNLQMMQFSSPNRMQFVTEAMYREAMDNFNREIQEFRDNSVLLLREKFKGLVDHVMDRLSPDETGNRKIFRNSMVDNLKQFIHDFQSLNITNDTQLAEEIHKVSLLVDGVDANSLRNSENLAEHVNQIMGRVQANVDLLIETAPKRRVRYQKEGVAA